jgi:phasin
MASPKKPAPKPARPAPVTLAKPAPVVAKPAPVVAKPTPVIAKTYVAPVPPPFESPAPKIETAPPAEAAPYVDPAPIVEAAAAEIAAPAAEVDAPLVEPAPVAPVTEPKPAPLEATVAKTEAPFVLKIPEFSKMIDMTKLTEAPMATFTEAQDKARSLAEAGLTETRAKLTQFKSVAGEAASALESSFTTAKTGAMELNAKTLEAMKSTAEANFEFMKSAFAVKSPSEYVALQTEFARKQIEAAQTHAKAFGELAQKIATDSISPIKAQVSKSLNLPL